MEFIFLHADKHQSFYKLALQFLMEVARHIQSTQNRKLVIFLQYIKKKVLQLLLCSVFYCDAKHSDILQWHSYVRCYLFIKNIFSKLSKHLWQSLILVKFHVFKYKLLNIFRQTPLKYQKYYLRHLIVGIQTAFRLQKPYCKIF